MPTHADLVLGGGGGGNALHACARDLYRSVWLQRQGRPRAIWNRLTRMVRVVDPLELDETGATPWELFDLMRALARDGRAMNVMATAVYCMNVLECEISVRAHHCLKASDLPCFVRALHVADPMHRMQRTEPTLHEKTLQPHADGRAFQDALVHAMRRNMVTCAARLRQWAFEDDGQSTMNPLQATRSMRHLLESTDGIGSEVWAALAAFEALRADASRESSPILQGYSHWGETILACDQCVAMLRARVKPALLAVAMGTHPRLGARSPLRMLPSELLERHIVRSKLLPHDA